MSIFNNLDLSDDDPAPEAGPLVPSALVNRKGKKNPPFSEDPEILSRLSRVGAYLLKGLPAWQIAEKLNYPIGSAKRDIKRVRQLWKAEARSAISSEREKAQAQYNLVLAKAWDMVELNPDKAEKYLALVIAAQERIDKLTGANAPDEVKISGETTVNVRDIEKVRQERWAQVRQALGVLGEQAEVKA
jgi:hypothetical protein